MGRKRDRIPVQSIENSRIEIESFQLICLSFKVTNLNSLFYLHTYKTGIGLQQGLVFSCTKKKHGFVKVTKLGTTNTFLVPATKNFAATTKRFVNRTKHLVVVTKYFCYPYFNK